MRGVPIVVVASIALGACALKQPLPPDEMRIEAMPNVAVPERWDSEGGVQAAVADDWLASFSDAALIELVREALEYNSDLRVAAARVDIAAGYVKLAGATLYPQVNALARGGGKMSGDSSGLQGAAVIVTWELDLWGRVRSSQRGAQLNYDAAALDAAYARQSIAAQTAQAYFLATEAELQLAIANDTMLASERLVGLARDRLRVGNGDEYDVAISLASLDTYRDIIAQLELARSQALRALETLIGRYPGALIPVPTQFAAMPPPVPVGLPSELLERRPDVVAAERRVASALYGIEEAKAARLPRISLTASLSSISSDLFFLKQRNDPLVSIGAGLMAPIFLGGQLQAQVDIRTGEQAQAIADYGRIATRAFGEVENALSAGFALDQRTAILDRVIAENQRALDLSQVRFRVGSGDLRAVNQQQLALYSARSAEIHVETQRRVQRVNLHLALGGGFAQPDDEPRTHAKAEP